MGTGIITAPTRLTVDGITYDSGSIELTSQSGTPWTRQAGAPVLLKSPSSLNDPIMGTGLFLPGAVAAKSGAGQFWIPNADGTSFIRLLEANLKTAPAAASITDCMRVTIRGNASGSMSCDMNAVGAYFRQFGAQQIGAQTTNGGSILKRGICTRLRPTANITAAAVAFAGSYAGALNDTSKPKVIELMDAALNVIATTGPITGQLFSTIAGGLGRPWYFLSPVALAQGTDYYVGYRFTGALANNSNVVPYGSVVSGGVAAFTGSIATGVTAPDLYVMSQFDPTPDPGSWQAGGVADPGGNTYKAQTFALYGTTQSVTLTGEFAVIDIATVGTGGTPGSDLNVHFAPLIV